jgi:hypothetical protein
MSEDGFKYTLHFPTTYDSSGLDELDRDLERTKQDASEVGPGGPMSMPESRLGPQREENELIDEKRELIEEIGETTERTAEIERQAHDDVIRAIGLRDEREKEASDEEVKQNFARLGRLGIYGAAIKMTAGFAGAELNDLLSKVREIDPALADQFAGAEKFAQMLEAPIATVLSDLKGMAGDVMNALAGDPDGAVAGLEQAARRWEQNRLRISQVIQKELEHELYLLDRHRQTVSEIRAMADAEGSLEQAQRDSRDSSATRGGADAEVVAFQRAQEELATTIGGLREEVQMAQMLVDGEQRALNQLNRELETAKDQGNQSEVVAELERSIEATEQGLQRAKDQLKTLEITLPVKELEEATRTGEELKGLVAEQGEQTTQAVEAMRDQLEGMLPTVSEQGKQYVESAIKSFSAALEDGVISATDDRAIAQALAVFARAQESRNAEIMDQVEGLTRVLEAQKTVNAGLSARIEDLAGR